MIELPIGTRFYFDDILVEVVEDKCSNRKYENCCFFEAMNFMERDVYVSWCDLFVCNDSERHDNKSVVFDVVEE